MSLTEIQAAIAQPSPSEQTLVLQWVAKDLQGASAGIERTYANGNIFLGLNLVMKMLFTTNLNRLQVN